MTRMVVDKSTDHAKPHSICYFTTISKITKEIFVKICWQLKTPTRTWKCTRCIMQMSYLYASDFPFKNFCKLTQQAETIWKNVCKKSNDACSLSIRVQTTINHLSICFFTTISTSKKMFPSKARAEKGIAWHIDASRVVWTLIDNGKLANQIARLAAILVKYILFKISASGLFLKYS